MEAEPRHACPLLINDHPDVDLRGLLVLGFNHNLYYQLYSVCNCDRNIQERLDTLLYYLALG